LSGELLVGGFIVDLAHCPDLGPPLLMLCSSIFAGLVYQAFGFELLLGGCSCLDTLLKLIGDSFPSGLSVLFPLSGRCGEVLGLGCRSFVVASGLGSVVEEAPPVRAAFGNGLGSDLVVCNIGLLSAGLAVLGRLSGGIRYRCCYSGFLGRSLGSRACRCWHGWP